MTMQKIRFLGKKKVFDVELKTVYNTEHNRIQITFPDNIPDYFPCGFVEVNEHNENFVQANYTNMNYIYRDIDGQTFVMTDDSEDVYIEPVPTPEPAPYVPTLDDVKLSKSTEIISIYNNVMTTGTNATLSDGIIVNISITQDFINTTNTAYLSASTLYGTEGVLIPFEIDNVCYSLSPTDVIIIYIEEQKFIIYNKSLKNELLSTIDRRETIEEVEAITYSVENLDELGLSLFNTSIENGNNTINAIVQKFGIETNTENSEEEVVDVTDDDEGEDTV